MEQGEKENKRAKWVGPGLSEKKMGEPVDFVLMLPIQGTRFCYMIWLVRSMTVDKWVMIIEWMSSSFHEKYLHAHECYWSQSIEPQKKTLQFDWSNLYFTDMLLTYVLHDKCKWVDMWDQNKAFRLPHLFFSPRPCLAQVICRFFCTPPLRSLFADYINTIYTILQFACSACYGYWSHLLMPVWYSSRFHSLPLLMLMTTLC